jgi:hypothetical protein
MSATRYNRLTTFDYKFGEQYINITYLPLSRILIWIDVDIDSFDIKDKKKQLELEKTIRTINNQL